MSCTSAANNLSSAVERATSVPQAGSTGVEPATRCPYCGGFLKIDGTCNNPRCFGAKGENDRSEALLMTDDTALLVQAALGDPCDTVRYIAVTRLRADHETLAQVVLETPNGIARQEALRILVSDADEALLAQLYREGDESVQSEVLWRINDLEILKDAALHGGERPRFIAVSRLTTAEPDGETLRTLVDEDLHLPTLTEVLSGLTDKDLLARVVTTDSRKAVAMAAALRLSDLILGEDYDPVLTAGGLAEMAEKVAEAWGVILEEDEYEEWHSLAVTVLGRCATEIREATPRIKAIRALEHTKRDRDLSRSAVEYLDEVVAFDDDPEVRAHAYVVECRLNGRPANEWAISLGEAVKGVLTTDPQVVQEMYDKISRRAEGGTWGTVGYHAVLKAALHIASMGDFALAEGVIGWVAHMADGHSVVMSALNHERVGGEPPRRLYPSLGDVEEEVRDVVLNRGAGELTAAEADRLAERLQSEIAGGDDRRAIAELLYGAFCLDRGGNPQEAVQILNRVSRLQGGSST